MAERNYVPVRVPLPVDSLRRIERLIRQGRVPAESPEQFIVEAVRQRLVEVEPLPRARSWAEAPAEAPHQRAGQWALLGDTDQALYDDLMTTPPEVRAAPPGPDDWARIAVEAGIEPIFDLRETALAVPPPGIVFPVPDGVVADEPLFGLHNRDFPSLWAVARCANGLGMSRFLYGSSDHRRPTQPRAFPSRFRP
jgi:hypothetical protein